MAVRVHTLKIEKDYADSVYFGDKNFEVRNNDTTLAPFIREAKSEDEQILTDTYDSAQKNEEKNNH